MPSRTVEECAHLQDYAQDMAEAASALTQSRADGVATTRELLVQQGEIQQILEDCAGDALALLDGVAPRISVQERMALTAAVARLHLLAGLSATTTRQFFDSVGLLLMIADAEVQVRAQSLMALQEEEEARS